MIFFSDIFYFFLSFIVFSFSLRILGIFVDISDEKEKGGNLIFFKYFDLMNQQLRHVGHASFNSSDMVKAFIPIAKKMAGIPANESIRFFEEVNPERINSLNYCLTLKQSELITGDIVIIESDFEAYRARVDDTNYFKNLLSRTRIQFRPRKCPEREGFSLILSSKMTYSEVIGLVGERMGFPIQQIELFTEPDGLRLESFPLLGELMEGVPTNTLYVSRMTTVWDDVPKESECMSEVKNTMLVHSKKGMGHTCVCWKCWEELERRGDVCPVCREVFDFAVRNYS